MSRNAPSVVEPPKSLVVIGLINSWKSLFYDELKLTDITATYNKERTY